MKKIVKTRAEAPEINRQHNKIASACTLTTLLETMPHIVLILNHERQIVWANRCLAAQFKKGNITECIGQRPGEVFRCVNAIKSEFGCGAAKECQVCGALLAILESLNGQGADEECVFLTTENETLNLRFKACLIQVDGEDYDAVSVVDISDEKNKRMLERLFFHDIMNLAGSIQGFTDLLPELIEENTPTMPETLLVLANSASDLIELIKCQKTCSQRKPMSCQSMIRKSMSSNCLTLSKGFLNETTPIGIAASLCIPCKMILCFTVMNGS